jgi:hypothetical protein
MPLIYGEGRKAFLRLQLEIIKKIDDDSIYAWVADEPEYGLLASWPTAFAESGNIVQLNFPDDRTPWLPPAMTSIGLEMKGRYQRVDPYQLAIDARYNVHTVSTALLQRDGIGLFMHCGPYEANDIPVTQYWSRHHRGRALLIILRRFGATWQRINCRRLEFEEYSMDEPSRFDAYTVYYVKQQGL